MSSLKIIVILIIICSLLFYGTLAYKSFILLSQLHDVKSLSQTTPQYPSVFKPIPERHLNEGKWTCSNFWQITLGFSKLAHCNYLFGSSSSENEIVEYYEKELRQQGWQVERVCYKGSENYNCITYHLIYAKTHKNSRDYFLQLIYLEPTKSHRKYELIVSLKPLNE